MIHDFEYREYERVRNMENVMVNEEKLSSVVIEKKETYKKSELVSLREEIASYEEEIKFHRREARKLQGKERHEKHLFIRRLSRAVRWRYLSYTLLRGKDIRDVERTFNQHWARTDRVAESILLYVPKEQHQFWGWKEIKYRLESPYIFDEKSGKHYSIGREHA